MKALNHYGDDIRNDLAMIAALAREAGGSSAQVRLHPVLWERCCREIARPFLFRDKGEMVTFFNGLELTLIPDPDVDSPTFRWESVK